MSEQMQKAMDNVGKKLDGLSKEQADRVMSRALDFIAGAAYAEKAKEART